MWVIYHKKSKSIVGMSADSELDIPKELALEEVVKGLVESEAPSNYDAIRITDRQQAQAIISAPKDRLLVLKNTKGKLQVAIKEVTLSHLLVTCDAPDVHPVDGIPEIKADGKSFTTISVQKADEQAKPRKSSSDNDLVYLRADYGHLFSVDGKEEISSVKLKKGQAAFRLVSEKARRVATVHLFNADSTVYDGTIRIEFI